MIKNKKKKNYYYKKLFNIKLNFLKIIIKKNLWKNFIFLANKKFFVSYDGELKWYFSKNFMLLCIFVIIWLKIEKLIKCILCAVRNMCSLGSKVFRKIDYKFVMFFFKRYYIIFYNVIFDKFNYSLIFFDLILIKEKISKIKLLYYRINKLKNKNLYFLNKFYLKSKFKYNKMGKRFYYRNIIYAGSGKEVVNVVTKSEGLLMVENKKINKKVKNDVIYNEKKTEIDINVSNNGSKIESFVKSSILVVKKISNEFILDNAKLSYYIPTHTVSYYKIILKVAVLVYGHVVIIIENCINKKDLKSISMTTNIKTKGSIVPNFYKLESKEIKEETQAPMVLFKQVEKSYIDDLKVSTDFKHMENAEFYGKKKGVNQKNIVKKITQDLNTYNDNDMKKFIEKEGKFIEGVKALDKLPEKVINN